MLHRTVTQTAEATLRVFATKRGDSYFGTPFLVGKSGNVYQTARLDRVTNHVARMNTSSTGIEVVGMPLNYRSEPTVGPPHDDPVVSWQPLAAKQTASVAYVVKCLMLYYDLPFSEVKVHERLQAKPEGEGGTVFDAIAPFFQI